MLIYHFKLHRNCSCSLGIRFNYYDEELGDEKNRNLEKPSSTVTAKRINDSVDSELKNTNESSVADDKPPGNKVLKLAAGVEEDADPCQVIPVEELQDEKGKGGTSEAPADDKNSSGGKDAKSEDPEGNSDTKEQAGTPEEKNDSKEPERTSEDTSGTKEQTSTSEEKSETKDQVGTTDEVDNENKVGAVSEEVTESVKSETDVAEKPEKVDDNLSDETHESDEKKPESSEEGKDEFKEMAESIKGADINFDGTERRSPQALLRKLSLNSQNDIMEKVVKLRVLKQSLKVRGLTCFQFSVYEKLHHKILSGLRTYEYSKMLNTTEKSLFCFKTPRSKLKKQGEVVHFVFK